MTLGTALGLLLVSYALLLAVNVARQRRQARRLAAAHDALERALVELRDAEARGVVADAELVLLRFGRRLVERDELTAPELVTLLNLVLADDDARRHR